MGGPRPGRWSTVKRSETLHIFARVFPDVTNIYDWSAGVGRGGFDCNEYIRLIPLRRPLIHRIYLLLMRAPTISSHPGPLEGLVCHVRFAVAEGGPPPGQVYTKYRRGGRPMPHLRRQP